MDNQRTTKSLLSDGINMNAIIIALIVVFFTIVVLFLIKRRKVGRNVILVGLCDSGKTLIFSQILHEKFVNTHTSIKENNEEYIVNNKPLQLIDIPGHERLRDKFFDKFKSGARGIVFVIDSATLQKSVRDVAEYLYVILTDSIVDSVRPKILILCNKQDELSAKGAEIIQSILEKEFNTLRRTKSSQLQSVSSENDKKAFLGRDDKDFEFSHVAHLQIEFAESTAVNKDQHNPMDLEQVKMWLTKVA